MSEYSHYEIKDELDQGAYGTVYEGIAHKVDGSITPVVFKILKSDKEDLYELECNRFLIVNPHKNIVSIIECIDCIKDKNKNKEMCKKEPVHETRLVILEKMEYSVNEYLDYFDSKTDNQYRKLCLDIFLQICNGVRYLHKNGYIHTDIKPDNIMINDKQKSPVVKIIDLGTIVKADSGMCSLGTPGFQDYCQYNGNVKRGDRFKIDIYQLGATFYDIFYFKSLQSFDSATDVFPDKPSPYENVFKDAKDVEKFNTLDKLIYDMIDENLDNRPKIDDVIKRLKEMALTIS